MLLQGDYDEMIQEMSDLQQAFNFKVFGGCCGTNDIFLNNLSKMLVKNFN